MTDRLWYVLITDPQAERRVQERTKHLGHEVYIPMARTFRSSASRRGGTGRIYTPIIEKPLFSGYVFVNLRPEGTTPFSSYIDDELVNAPPQSVEFWEDGVLRKVEVRSGDDAKVGGQRFISNAGCPAPLALGIIEDLKAREAAGEFDETALSDDGRYVIPDWIKLGKTVRVIAGPFAGFVGSISKIINARMVSVWLTMFGRASLVDMPLIFIEKSR